MGFLKSNDAARSSGRNSSADKTIEYWDFHRYSGFRRKCDSPLMENDNGLQPLKKSSRDPLCNAMKSTALRTVGLNRKPVCASPGTKRKFSVEPLVHFISN